MIDENKVGLKEKTEDTRYIKKIHKNKTQSTGSAGVRAKDMIPNFAIIGNCRLGNWQGRHSLEGPERGEIHAHSKHSCFV